MLMHLDTTHVLYLRWSVFIFINDTLKVARRSNLFIYADDLVVCFTDADFGVALCKIESDLSYNETGSNTNNLLLIQYNLMHPYYSQISLSI